MNIPLRFEWPMLLWALALVPLALAVYLLVQRGSARDVARFATPSLLPNLVPRTPGWRRHAPAAFYLLALTGLLAALARPQAVMAVPREEATLVMVMDVSSSMAATDVQPNRMSAANTSAKRFLDTLPASLRVSLVSFSNGAQVQSAPTVDRDALRRALDTLRPGGGTAMGEAIQLAIGMATAPQPGQSAQSGSGVGGWGGTGGSGGAGAQAEPPPAAILLLSDGANTAGTLQPLEAAERARQLGIPIFTIALGTAAGTIENPDKPGSGELMSVPPDEDTLQRVAQLTGGRFFKAPTAADLQQVYAELGSQVSYAEEEQEITHAFLAGGAVLMAVGSGLALLWFNRFP